MGFIRKVKESPKPVLKQLYQLSSTDVMTVTGSNLREILLLTNKTRVENMKPTLVDNITYHKLEENYK